MCYTSRGVCESADIDSVTSCSGHYMIFDRELNRLEEFKRYLGDAYHTFTSATNCYKIERRRTPLKIGFTGGPPLG
jgi:hypothetical protein